MKYLAIDRITKEIKELKDELMPIMSAVETLNILENRLKVKTIYEWRDPEMDPPGLFIDVDGSVISQDVLVITTNPDYLICVAHLFVHEPTGDNLWASSDGLITDVIGWVSITDEVKEQWQL